MATWLEERVMAVAFIFSASARSRSGEIIRSSLEMTNHDGLVFQAAVVIVAPKADAEVGPCVTVNSSFSQADKSCAKSSEIPLGVRVRNPVGSCGISVPTGVAGYGLLIPN